MKNLFKLRALTSSLLLSFIQHPLTAFIGIGAVAPLATGDTKAYMKPGAPVRIIPPEHSAVALTEEAELNFVFSSRHYGDAELRVWADEALSHDLPDIMDLDFSQGLITLPVTISSNIEGRHHIYMSVTMNGLTRNISYAQTFGDEKTVAAQRKITKPAVNGIKRFKAKETVRIESSQE